MKKSSLVAVAALSAALIAPAAAIAAPAPKFTSRYIVPTKSLGGLKLGAPASTASVVFGAKQCTTGGCSYTAPDQSWTVSVVFAAKTAKSKPFIGEIDLTAAKPSAPTLPDLKTASGIGIGSTAAELKHAYPTLLGSKLDYYTATKLPLTVYAFTGSRLTSISLRSVELG
jgi:hypothetical protein